MSEVVLTGTDTFYGSTFAKSGRIINPIGIQRRVQQRQLVLLHNNHDLIKVSDTVVSSIYGTTT